MKFLRFLYEENKDIYIGMTGPYDAFTPHYNWKTKRCIAIDQVTIDTKMEITRTSSS